MRIPNSKVADIVFESFRKAFEKKDTPPFQHDNPHRSAYFVSEIGRQVEAYFKGAKPHYMAVDSSADKKKMPGEWLFDICVTSQLEIIDERHKDGRSWINTNILFACESEFDTSLSSFATDFGKLICSNANQYLFIQGLNQSTEQGRKDFINSRKSIIRTYLEHLIRDDFVLAFIPTPGIIKGQSYWDTNEKEVLSWASIWVYNASENDFIEHPIE